MLKRILLFFIATSTVFLCLLFFLRSKDQPNKTLKFSSDLKNWSNLKELRHPLIDEMNTKNSGYTSFICENIDVKVWQSGQRFKLTGKMHYEKPNNFRLEIHSVLGKEIDIGSNSEVFWYWSKRDKRPGLYWAYHKDFGKTRLKTPFNPLFFKASLGLELIDKTRMSLHENNTHLMVSMLQKSALGKDVLYSVFVDKTRKVIDGFIVSSLQGKSLAAVEIQEHVGDLPGKVLYTWHEEDRIMQFSFKKGRTNVALNPSLWQMPRISPAINMAEE